MSIVAESSPHSYLFVTAAPAVRLVAYLKLKLQITKDVLKQSAGWWFGCHFLFSHIWGMSSSQLTVIFFRGVALAHQAAEDVDHPTDPIRCPRRLEAIIFCGFIHVYPIDSFIAIHN